MMSCIPLSKERLRLLLLSSTSEHQEEREGVTTDWGVRQGSLRTTQPLPSVCFAYHYYGLMRHKSRFIQDSDHYFIYGNSSE